MRSAVCAPSSVHAALIRPKRFASVGRALPAIVSSILGRSPTYFSIVKIGKLKRPARLGPRKSLRVIKLEVDRDQS
jgi:hypothetical protein